MLVSGPVDSKACLEYNYIVVDLCAREPGVTTDRQCR